MSAKVDPETAKDTAEPRESRWVALVVGESLTSPEIRYKTTKGRHRANDKSALSRSRRKETCAVILEKVAVKHKVQIQPRKIPTDAKQE